MKAQIQDIINHLELQKHPEGGYFKETYRSAGQIAEAHLDGDYEGARNYATSIYFMLTSDEFSALHRIKQDEIWHYYDGSPIKLHVISPAGEHSIHHIGKDLNAGQVPQFVVPGGCWFASQVLDPDSFSLAGCTVAPGFSFADFEMPTRAEFLALFPQHESLITALTHR
jgi:hypothetical protein